MKLLLDTHTLLWLINEPNKLSHTALNLLRNEDNTLVLSISSTWEIAIKASLGKLSELQGGVRAIFAKINEMPISILPLKQLYIEAVETLPFIHRDPFDRLLIAIALVDDFTIMTSDKDIHNYNVSTVW